MKIATLNRTIMHKQNPAQDEQRLAAFEESADMFMAEIAQEMREEYIVSHAGLLATLDCRITGIMVCGQLVIIQYVDKVKYADTAGMNRSQITEALIHCVTEY